MKGRIFGTLFAIPFAGFGVWMLLSVGSTLGDAWQMQDWSATPARLSSAGYETRSGDDADTYKAYAVYSYTWLGRTYTGSRVTISDGADNIGDYQVETGNRLAAAMARGEPITVWVNPEQPAESVIDRNLRWGMLAFKSVFAIVFGGVGFGLLYAVWRTPQPKDASSPELQASPWLVNDAWQTSAIRSGSKLAMRGAWAFAVFWNLISGLLPFVAWDEVVNKQNYPALLALLFPLVGIFLLAWAIRRTLEWRRFGAAPVNLDPYPGSIGGHVGGTIDIGLPYDPGAVFEVTLTNIYSYESGSGDDRSQREKAKWQDKMVAHTEPGTQGTRILFRFDVPGDLHASDADKSGDNYYLWRLDVAAELAGADFDRSYEIPVYPTAETSRYLPRRVVEQAREATGGMNERAAREVFTSDFGPGGKRLVYPMFRHFGASLGTILFGVIFAGAGAFIGIGAGHPILGTVFGAVGGLVLLLGLYIMLNSLEVSQDGGSIRAVRRILGIPVSDKTMPCNAFSRFDKKSSMQMQSGGKHTVFYTVAAVDGAGNRLTVGEGFRGASEADAAMRVIACELGLDLHEPPRREDPPAYGADVLTADQ